MKEGEGLLEEAPVPRSELEAPALTLGSATMQQHSLLSPALRHDADP